MPGGGEYVTLSITTLDVAATPPRWLASPQEPSGTRVMGESQRWPEPPAASKAKTQ